MFRSLLCRSFLTALCLTAHMVMAHPALENTLDIRIEETRVIMDVQVTLEEILTAQGVKPGADGSYDAQALEGAAQRHCGYLVSHLGVEANGTDLRLRPGRVLPPPHFSSPHTTFYHYEIAA